MPENGRIVFVKEGETRGPIQNGTYQSKRKEIESPRKFFNWGKVGVSGFIIFAVVVLWQTALWYSSVNVAIKNVAKNTEAIKEIKKDISSYKLAAKQVTNKNPSSPGTKGYIALINEESSKGNMTTFNVPYYLECNVCIFNESFGLWEKIEGKPNLGNFINIENLNTSLATWCMVIGSFVQKEKPHRAFLVSQPVANKIKYYTDDKAIATMFRTLPKSQWRKNKNCVELFEKKYNLND